MARSLARMNGRLGRRRHGHDGARHGGPGGLRHLRPPETVLWVLDNSDSMVAASTSLAVGIDDVLAALPADTQVGLTTMDVEASAGALVGPLTSDAATLQERILCEATCFLSDLVLPSDPAHTCGDPLGDEVTSEWLDCTCGAGAWWDPCGSAVEEGLEALWLATCRGDAAAPSECFDGLLDASEGGSVDLGDAVHAVLISDEGDGSLRQNREPDVLVYTDLLASSSLAVTVSVVVPPLDAGAVLCPGTATERGVLRYVDAINRTAGEVAGIFDSGCAVVDVAVAVESVLAP